MITDSLIRSYLVKDIDWSFFNHPLFLELLFVLFDCLLRILSIFLRGFNFNLIYWILLYKICIRKDFKKYSLQSINVRIPIIPFIHCHLWRFYRWFRWVNHFPWIKTFNCNWRLLIAGNAVSKFFMLITCNNFFILRQWWSPFCSYTWWCCPAFSRYHFRMRYIKTDVFR